MWITDPNTRSHQRKAHVRNLKPYVVDTEVPLLLQEIGEAQIIENGPNIDDVVDVDIRELWTLLPEAVGAARKKAKRI